MQEKLTATFQRQAWVRNDAVDTEDAQEINVTAAFLALSAGEVRSLHQESARSMTAQETDWFAQHLGLLKGFGKSETGYLYFETEAIADFAGALGVDVGDGRFFDEGAMKAMRSAHAAARKRSGRQGPPSGRSVVQRTAARKEDMPRTKPNQRQGAGREHVGCRQPPE